MLGRKFEGKGRRRLRSIQKLVLRFLYGSILRLLFLCSNWEELKLRTQMWVEGLVSSTNRTKIQAAACVFGSKGRWLNQSTLDLLGFIANQMFQQLHFLHPHCFPLFLRIAQVLHCIICGKEEIKRLETCYIFWGGISVGLGKKGVGQQPVPSITPCLARNSLHLRENHLRSHIFQVASHW